MTQRGGPPRRHLGLVDATAVYAGIILGSGIFVAPAAVAGAAASPAAAVLLWIAGACVAACGASCYAECAGRVPANGGFFVFQREAFGPAFAYVSGWTAVLVTYPASIAAIALVFSSYLQEALGYSGGERVAAAGALILAGALNVVGLRTGPRAQIVLTGTKVAVLSGVAIAAMAHPGSGSPPHTVATVAPAPVIWLSALMLLLWTYDGWSDVTLVAGEVREPGRNLGRAVLCGTGALAIVYGITQLAVMKALPDAADSARPVADAAAVYWGPSAARGIAALVVVCTFGSIAGTVFAVSRLAYAMASDGALVRSIGTLHPRWATPARATAALTIAAVAYAVWGRFRGILALFTFSVWIFYGATAVALLVLRRRKVGEPVAWRAPLGVLSPVVVLGVGAGMTVQLVAEDPLRALGGCALLGAAFPVYALIARSGARPR